MRISLALLVATLLLLAGGVLLASVPALLIPRGGAPAPALSGVPDTPIIVSAGRPYCGVDKSSIAYCIVIFGAAPATLFPPIFEPLPTTPVAVATGANALNPTNPYASGMYSGH